MIVYKCLKRLLSKVTAKYYSNIPDDGYDIFKASKSLVNVLMDQDDQLLQALLYLMQIYQSGDARKLSER